MGKRAYGVNTDQRVWVILLLAVGRVIPIHRQDTPSAVRSHGQIVTQNGTLREVIKDLHGNTETIHHCLCRSRRRHWYQPTVQ